MLSASGQECGDIVDIFSNAANFASWSAAKRLIPNIAGTAGQSNYDIIANYFLTVVKLAASSRYHPVTH
jgi:hypothetical protein